MKTLISIGAFYFITGCVIAAVHTQELDYEQGETQLRGYLAYDDGNDKKRPGVLVVHEWWGLNDHAKRKAEALANEGYIAFALDMYGEGKNTVHPEEAGEWAGYIRQNMEIGKERFSAAYRLLQSQAYTDGKKIAAIGYCFGGTVVLTMAQLNIDLKGVVSFHGGLPTEKIATGPIKAKILVCHGADDPLISQEQIQIFQNNMREAGADWQFIAYGGAKHSFTNPDADKRELSALGYHRSADKRSWKAMLTLFQEIFSY